MAAGEPSRSSSRSRQVRLRPALDGLPAYVPGAVGVNASVFKLSSNENPNPPLGAVVAAIADAAVDVNRYPAMHADALVEAIAAKHDQLPERVFVGPGAVALLELVLRSACTDGDEVIYPWRSFESFPLAIRVTGAKGRPVLNRPDGGHDLDGMLAAVTPRTRAVLLCNPNNPTGVALTDAEVRDFLDRLPAGVLVILDEAYAAFDRTEGGLDGPGLLPDHRNVVVLRTFSKAYGLAGLRVGYGLARRRLVAALRVASTPFGISSIGQAAAIAALGQQAAIDAQVEEIVAERERIHAALVDQGWRIPRPQGNFYWLPIANQAAAFASAALAAGITVRPFAGAGVRVSVGEREANDIALGVCAEFAGRAAR